MKFYVGCSGYSRLVFKAEHVPTSVSHGDRYVSVIGPFRTKRGATFMALHGRNNPHIQTVSDAERLAKRCA